MLCGNGNGEARARPTRSNDDKLSKPHSEGCVYHVNTLWKWGCVVWVEVLLGRLIVDQVRERYEVELCERRAGGRRMLMPIGVVDTALCERWQRHGDGRHDPNRTTIEMARALEAEIVAAEIEAAQSGELELVGRLQVRRRDAKRCAVAARPIDACLIAARLGVPIRVAAAVWERWAEAGEGGLSGSAPCH